MNISDLADTCESIVTAVGKAIVGKDAVLRQVLTAVLADGHVLMEDFPGLAKTLMASSFSQALEISFRRVQFTPDLLPGDITGNSVYNRERGVLEFSRGPVFANLLLADEINRATPKTQSALLEAMQERQVTIEGTRHELEPPFLVFATQNPIEFEGTYPLPEAQLDRFIMRIGVGYPSAEDELDILLRREARGSDAVRIDPVVDRAELLGMQALVEEVHVGREVGRYMVEIVRQTRDDPRTQVGASPRGSLAMFKLARAAAAMDARDFVTPEDVKVVAVASLAHRLILTPEHWVRGEHAEDVVREILGKVETPRAVSRD